MTFIHKPNVETHVSPYAQPKHVEAHNGNPFCIVRLSDGRHVSANADGQPLLDAQGRMETWSGSDHLAPEQARAIWRGTDPHVQTTHASIDDGAAAREQLRARGFTNV